MKAIVNTLLVALTLTVTSFSTTQADTRKPKQAAAFQSGMHTTAEGKVQIAVQKETTGAVTVRLINAEGREVFVQPIGKRQQAVRLRLDVSSLPDGIYQIAISNGLTTTTQELTLATKRPTAAPRLIAVR
ncbi:T9SS type A sorting domain-containing protein [Larkinella insperata]|uniref:T9SS type A sorting domain-containing protein n=1 Tax=Larkinella insperata TaxID=332158 RepID=A0ABW3QJD5_9BACT|nr:T9SS type A sorting domain-containing protein [Larkinella insperata]